MKITSESPNPTNMRSKEEILKLNLQYGPNNKQDYINDIDAWVFKDHVINAMDQSVAEFKERLKEAIRYDLTISMGNADKILTLIDETK